MRQAAAVTRRADGAGTVLTPMCCMCVQPQAEAALQAANAAWLVLQDDEQRAAYDAARATGTPRVLRRNRAAARSPCHPARHPHLRACAATSLASQAVVISATVCLDDMDLDEGANAYSHPCRCGDSYTVRALPWDPCALAVLLVTP